jgi:AbrB family looped-hinge helix DNA binding protein
MESTTTKITSQGQVSVPAAVRSFLNLTPGSVLVWSQDGDRVVVQRATRHTTADVHRALFGESAPAATSAATAAKSLDELKQGIRQRMQRRHAGG